jgi:hypothetical protein
VERIEEGLECRNTSVGTAACGCGDDTFEIAGPVGVSEQAPFSDTQTIGQARTFVVKNPSNFVSGLMASWRDVLGKAWSRR